MNDQQLQEVAAFRFGIIAPVVQRKLQSGERYALLRELAAHAYTIPYSDSTRISIRSLERYLQAYEQGGFEALKPKAREKKGSLHHLDPQILSMAVALRRELPSRSVETIIRMLELDEHAPVAPGVLKARTLSRYLQEQRVSKQDLIREGKVSKAFRHFEHDEVNDCWQADTQHTTTIWDPQDPNKRRKVYLIAFIDDHSRRIVHAEFFFEERYPRLENCLMKAVLRHGVPRIFYCDNGSVYNAKQLGIVCARMGTKLLHAKPYSPESKGKIEKFFQFVDSSFTGEVNLLIEQKKLQTLEQLNLYLRSWLDAYDVRTHRTTKQTPKARFEAGHASIRRLPREDLQALFLWEEERMVRKTAVIEIEGNRYDVDDALRGHKVQVRYNPFDLTVIQVWKDGIRYADAKTAELRTQRHQKLPTDDPKPVVPSPVANYVEMLQKQRETKKRTELGTTSFAQLKKRQTGDDGTC